MNFETVDHAIAQRLRRQLTGMSAHSLPLVVDGAVAGWLTPARGARLLQYNGVFVIRDHALAFVAGLDTPEKRTDALDRITRDLAGEGALSAWRDERYAVAPALGAAPWFLLERAAARYFGINSWAVHANGLVGQDAPTHMWLARRSASKAIDPGMLDNLVGGGLPAGMSPYECLVKEAWEEAGLTPSELNRATHVSTLQVERGTDDGLFRETILVYDFVLRPEFVPANQDGEAVDHRCTDLGEIAPLIALDEGPDQVTVEASLVILDALLRLQVLPPDGPAAQLIGALRLQPGIANPT